VRLRRDYWLGKWNDQWEGVEESKFVVERNLWFDLDVKHCELKPYFSAMKIIRSLFRILRNKVFEGVSEVETWTLNRSFRRDSKGYGVWFMKYVAGELWPVFSIYSFCDPDWIERW